MLVALLTDKKNKSRTIRSSGLTGNAPTHRATGERSASPALARMLKDDGPFHVEVALAMITIDPDGTKSGARVDSQDTRHDDRR